MQGAPKRKAEGGNPRPFLSADIGLNGSFCKQHSHNAEYEGRHRYHRSDDTEDHPHKTKCAASFHNAQAPFLHPGTGPGNSTDAQPRQRPSGCYADTYAAVAVT